MDDPFLPSFPARSRGVNPTIVKDLMVPLSEYATVPEGSTLYDAVLALEKAQEKFALTRYHHRAVLILNRENRVIGKLSQLDVLRALEPKNEAISQFLDIGCYGFSPTFINRLREQHRLAGGIVKDIRRKAASLRVEDFMQAPSQGEYVEEDTSLDTAIHQLVAGTHLSLLVTREKEIVGILRMSDVFSAVFHTLRDDEQTA
jgi:CBS domain-containing protein